MNKENLIKKIVAVAFIVMAIAIVMPVAIGAGYTYLCEDDFSFEAGALDQATNHGDFNGAVIRAAEYYMSTQGTYLFNFTVHFIRAYTRWGLPGFHFVMLVILFCFSLSLYFLVITMFKDRVMSSGLFFAAMAASFLSVSSGNLKELFFWYTGALNFTLELTLSFFSLAMCIRAASAKGKTMVLYVVISALSGFLASGGALEITAPNCGFLLAYMIIEHKKVKENSTLVIPFVFSMLGAVFNVVAPGNFRRSGEGIVQGHEGVLDALRDTFVCYFNEAKIILGSTQFLAVLAFVFIIAVYTKVELVKGGMKKTWLAVILLGSFLMQYFTAFPVIFGYHSTALVRMRTTGAYEFIARIMYMFAVIGIAQFVREKIPGKAVLVGAALFVISIFVGLISGQLKADTKNSFVYQIQADLRDGSMKEAYTTREYVLATLDLAEEGSDVYIEVPLKRVSGASYGMGLMDDPNSFVNVSCAGLFRLNSVTVVYTD